MMQTNHLVVGGGTRTCALVASLTLLVVVWAGPNRAYAEDPPASQDAAENATDGNDGADERAPAERFKEHVARGASLRRQGNLRLALIEFEKARTIADHPKLMLVSGRLHERLGDCGGARAIFAEALEERRASRALRSKIEEALGHNDECVDHGTLVVECSPPSVALEVDQKPLECGQSLDLPPGKYTLAASASGYHSQKIELVVEAGQLQHQRLALSKKQPQRPVSTDVSTPPWVTYSAWGTLGAGATLMLAGMISDAGATARQRQLDDASSRGDYQRVDALVDQAHSAQTRTAVLYTSGAVLVAAGGALWAFDHEVARWLLEPTDQPVQAQIVVSEQTTGVRATLRW